MQRSAAPGTIPKPVVDPEFLVHVTARKAAQWNTSRPPAPPPTSAARYWPTAPPELLPPPTAAARAKRRLLEYLPRTSRRRAHHGEHREALSTTTRRRRRPSSGWIAQHVATIAWTRPGRPRWKRRGISPLLVSAAPGGAGTPSWRKAVHGAGRHPPVAQGRARARRGGWHRSATQQPSVLEHCSGEAPLRDDIAILFVHALSLGAIPVWTS